MNTLVDPETRILDLIQKGPSLFAPWYIVQRFVSWEPECPICGSTWDPISDNASYQIEYWTFQDEGSHDFDQRKDRAMIFLNLSAAVRVAEEENAEIRVLTSEKERMEFGR